MRHRWRTLSRLCARLRLVIPDLQYTGHRRRCAAGHSGRHSKNGKAMTHAQASLQAEPAIRLPGANHNTTSNPARGAPVVAAQWLQLTVV